MSEIGKTSTGWWVLGIFFVPLFLMAVDGGGFLLLLALVIAVPWGLYAASDHKGQDPIEAVGIVFCILCILFLIGSLGF